MQLKLGLAIINGLQIIGTDSCTAHELSQVFAFMDATGLRVEISAELDLEQAQKAHELLAAKDVRGRVVLRLSRDW